MTPPAPSAPDDPALAFEASFAGLITRLGADAPVWDRAFCRRLAVALHEVCDRLEIDALDALQLRDVALTLRLERALEVVVTGRAAGVPGELTLRWREADLPAVAARIGRQPRPEPILICTLDGSWRGRRGVLAVASGVLPAGTPLQARALATIGGRAEVRVEVGDRAYVVSPEAVRWQDADRGEATAALLAAHVAGDELEARHQAAIAALLRHHAVGSIDAFDRRTFTPGHITASAFVLSADRRAVLLIWHERLQRWLQPGGHVEPGDADVVAAARREVEEETGLTGCAALGEGLFDVDVHAIPARSGAQPEPAHEHHDLRIALLAPQGAAPRAGDGVSAARFFDLEALLAGGDEPGGVGTDASVMRAVRRLRDAAAPLAAPSH